MTTRTGRQEQVPLVVNLTAEEINSAITTINRLFDGILGRGTVTNIPQFIRFKIVSVVPTVASLDEGELVFYELGTTRRLYTKINGSIRYVALT